MSLATADAQHDPLAEFVRSGSERSFAEIVERYSDMVYGTALRRTGSAPLAEEISQNVFALLARKAAGLRSERALGTWLHRTTILEARNFLRAERNHRQKVEHYARSLDPPDSAALEPGLPYLDEAINRLPEADRRVILLRFFEGLSFKEIGVRLGKSDDACQKRTSRALESLSGILRRRGVALSAAAIASGLAAQTAKAAPASVKASLAKAALLSLPAGAPTTSLLKIMAYTNWKLTAAVAVAALIPLTIQWTQNRSLASKLEQLEQQSGEPISANSPSALITAHTPGRAPASLAEESIEQLKRNLARAEASPHRHAAYAQLVAEIGMVPAESMPEAFRLLMASPLNALHGQTNLDLINALFSRWSCLAPAVALEAARSVHPNGQAAVTSVYSAWVLDDPDSALDSLARSRTSLSQGAWQSVVESTLRAFAIRDPAQAAEYVLDFDAGPRTDEVVSTTAAYWAMTDPEAALAWADALENEEQRSRAILYTAMNIANTDPVSASELVSRLHPGKHRNQLVAVIRDTWAKTDGEAAEAWFRQQQDPLAPESP